MSGSSSPSSADEIAAVDRAIETLEAQRAVLGDAVVETALEPLRARREELAAPRGEQRRLVTVVFADLVDFTVLSRRLDAEDTREVVGTYFARWQRAIEDEGGVVEKFIGDAVMAVFGLRRSFEDDAHRAIRASLRMLAELDELNAQIEPRYGVRLQMRVGIDTGEVVVSTLGERGSDFVAVGPTVNRAARLQAAAPVDRVLISAETQRQVRGAFGTDIQYGLALKGIDEPVEAFVVIGERRQGFRLDPSGRIEGVETTTVGRELPLRFLQERLQDVTEESHWRVVTVMGEAGVGKSRLLYDFDAWLLSLPDAFWWFRGRATPTSQRGVNALLRDMMTARLDIQVDDASTVVRQRFVDGFTTALGAEDGPMHAARVGAWLGFDLEVEGVELASDPQTMRDLGSESLGEYFRALSRRAPVSILLEDLHWADEGTLRWLDAVHPLLAEAQVFVVATARPSLLETHPRWGEGLAHHVRLSLAPLTRRESRQLVQQILRRVEDLPRELVELVIDSAEGNPFYIEELITWLLDAGVLVRGEEQWSVRHDLIGTVAVPSTLKGVLQARLDGLSLAERRLLQRASVVGRVFWDDAVARLVDAGEGLPDLEVELDNLRRRELLLEREVSAFASAREFLFKHALLRDVAYDGVLRAHRERYHQRAAVWLAETSTAVGRQDEYAAIIAEHFERARDPEAARWYLRAGVRATSVYALAEAERMLRSALDLVHEDRLLRFDILVAREELHDRTGDRESQQEDIDGMIAVEDELDTSRAVQLQLALSRWQFMRSDYATAAVYASRAVELAQSVGLEVAHTEAMLWFGKAQTWADEGASAERSLLRAAELARACGRLPLLGEALRYRAMLAGNNGDFHAALDVVTQAQEVFARTGDPEMEATALAQKATTLFQMSRYAEAQAALEATLPIFRRSGHRYREAINLGNLASIAMMRGHLATSERYALSAIELAQSLDEIESSMTYLLVLGSVKTFTSRFDGARDHLAEALRITRELGSESAVTDSLTRLSTLALTEGDVEDAVDRARESVRVAATVPSDLDRALAQQALGYAALAAGLWDEADLALATARQLFEHLELDSSARESLVGIAGVAAGRGDLAGGVPTLEPVLAHLDAAGLSGTQSPGRMLRTLVDVLTAAGDARAATALAHARTYLREMADEIGDPKLATGYLAVPVHASLLAAGD